MSTGLKIAVLGTGMMGLPMARRLAQAGHEVHAWNRTRAKAEPLAALGAFVHDTPRQACIKADYVISMLENGQVVGDVLFAGSIGRVDLPGGSMAQMRSTLRKLRTAIEESASILPGHGPSTTMARELAANPYLTEEMLA